MAWTTLVGLLLGFGAVLISNLLEGGSPASLLNAPAAVIVFGGTFGTAMISFPPEVTLQLFQVIMHIFQHKLPDRHEVIGQFIDFANKARQQGLLALEEEAGKLNDPFFKKALQLAVDGTDPKDLRGLLEIDIKNMESRHASHSAILAAMGGYAPTMGIIGTVMGLVNVLSKLGEDPAGLGHSIATAFLATLYGVGTANLLWLPLGAKLRAASEEEALLRHLIMEGVLAIQAGDNPHLVRTRLETFLPAKGRAQGEKAGSAGAAAPQGGLANG